MTHEEKERQVAEAYYSWAMQTLDIPNFSWNEFLQSRPYKAIPQANEWIPVSERLPERLMGIDVWVTTSSPHRLTDCFHDGTFFCYANNQGTWYKIENVTHWREWPKPPKPEQKGE